MASLSIRDLDDQVRDRLRLRAARHGRSMEAEVRAILVEAVSESAHSESLFGALREHFGALGGVELELPGRTGGHRAVELSD